MRTHTFFKANAIGLLLILVASARPVSSADVTLKRVPDGGIQPQAIVDARGVTHLIYYKGDPAGGDIFYVHSKDAGASLTPPIKVNSQSGSAIAMGNIRGAHIAIGKNGRVHVAWMGSNTAAPRGPSKEAPMLYARLDDAGTAFEPQRNVITSNYGLDGGGTVAADDKGDVYVVWHGGGGGKGEDFRSVWVARSTDDGKTFATETSALSVSTGACGCCGISALADAAGTVRVLYRSAGEKVNRDMFLLTSHDKGSTFSGQKLDAWNANMCPMSTASLSASATETVISWENKGQIFFGHVAPDTKSVAPIAAPGQGQGRKHPSVAVNAAGETLLVWTEGMGWAKGGSLSWQLYDKVGKPTQKGTEPGVPKWSLIATFARPDGGFTILY
jgi:hypothetical protein